MRSFQKCALAFWIPLAICLLLSAGVVRLIGVRAIQIERAEVECQLADRANAFRQALWLRLHQLETLDMLLRLHDGLPIHFTDGVENMKRLSAVNGILLAPDGIVSRAWPVEQEPRYVGLNLLTDPALQRLVRAGKNISLSGPFPVSEDESVLCGYKLVYLPGKDGQRVFWGVLAFCFGFEDVLREAGLDTPTVLGRNIRLVRDDGMAAPPIFVQTSRNADFERYRPGNATLPDSGNVLEYAFDTDGTWWALWAYPVGIWWKNASVWPIALGCLAGSVLVALLVRQVCALRRTRRALEQLLSHDPLTGALNRHGLFQALAGKGQAVGKRAFLAYVDLNKFKRVNDSYGHETGDRMLKAFVRAVYRHVTAGTLLARIGGDEFVILFPAGVAYAEVKRVIAAIRETYAEPLELRTGEALRCEFACGLAFWPEREDNFQAVLHKADIAMYRDKHGNAKGNRDI
ncbi:MAG TPA: sensor domain-containing diguanylate cyclase [Candidatus Desulfovibrio intestinavium]|uniref:diguanylate cyclase n=1 Tax=Candidatus Desulfovibrio intestinavium TaxID=2838534 RepID=A0A9D2HPW8_9BACT|nr:sensor domain-containing diguanylate cyclase [Candidatus Desulfovibrio intestinavium]